MPNELRKRWSLDPELDFLNHGSFGATPTAVLDEQRRLILQLEADPIRFLAPERELLPKLDHVRQVIARLVGAAARDIVFVRNTTEGVSAVVRSFPFRRGDEVLITNHGYNACNNAVRYAAQRSGADVVVAEVPFPIQSADQVIEAIEDRLTDRTRLLMVDHVTSPTGLIFPVTEIVAAARQRGVRVLIDGSHAPGMLAVDLNEIQPDYYVANHHKWLCGPKTSAFLFARGELQPEVRATAISHGPNRPDYGETKFQADFSWPGTFDPTPLLVMPFTLDFLGKLHDGGIDTLMAANRQLALAGRRRLLNRLEIDDPAPEQMIGSLATIPISQSTAIGADQVAALQRQFAEKDRIEVPLFGFDQHSVCVRISAQAYNHLDQFERLGDLLQRTFRCGS
ncbi:aminotransferase class V-fold PLP-dependent enzyme [Stieleria sp. TO1_6]|uniref:aminotransferase class V-fold PLP-dependent enzyme n=1 Tax=Stieleria tagensis TaxID=2956795 RepID=UPI00209B19F3|nr:aminotransferase class V-fold PLP-dependent enzyme [Stieleria tagensis]MCO8122334.1 aminotransferase class V-fold PLP-dependent enzyme [Stieleria tagensis]